jgi:4-diphosphocytidyl-2C-methyl-D-erythritol kinase
MKEEGFSKDLLKKKEDADNKMILSGMNYIGKIGEEKGENCKINVFTGSGSGVTFKYEEEKEIRNLQTGTTDKVHGNVSVKLFKRRNKEMETVYKEIRERVSKARK